MGCFLLVLNKDIVDEVEVYDYATMDDLLDLAIEAEMQQQRLAGWFNSISTRDSDSARFDDTTTLKVADLKTHHIDQPQMSNSSNAAFTSSKLDREELVEDVVSEDVVLEEPKMQIVSQGILGCEENNNQEEQKKHLMKEESITVSDEELKVDRQEARQAAAYFHEHLRGTEITFRWPFPSCDSETEMFHRFCEPHDFEHDRMKRIECSGVQLGVDKNTR
ncbi:hypothetical protein PIB30_036257 [Stylosanthes scabra]|uniref:Uncharacterized protein n=1 Tax=Stylosanthes scabra TaxID=79078 RepID=A0ABU6YBQ5_9FABA|nr:hypothetical protein [Stylosanthes scabra]